MYLAWCELLFGSAEGVLLDLDIECTATSVKVLVDDLDLAIFGVATRRCELHILSDSDCKTLDTIEVMAAAATTMKAASINWGFMGIAV